MILHRSNQVVAAIASIHQRTLVKQRRDPETCFEGGISSEKSASVYGRRDVTRVVFVCILWRHATIRVPSAGLGLFLSDDIYFFLETLDSGFARFLLGRGSARLLAEFDKTKRTAEKIKRLEKLATKP
jgi:hypothetical protein